MRILTLFFIFLISCTDAFAFPQCYEEAEIPAHKFPFLEMSGIKEVTGINFDGTVCVQHIFLDGEPIREQRIYTTLRRLYETYATAHENYLNEQSLESRENLIKIMSYLRPTPRPFYLWNDLFSVGEGALMPWGMKKAIALMKFLQPNESIYKRLNMNSEIPQLDMDRAWPTIFMLMGGELYPTERWSSQHQWGSAIYEIMIMRFPNFLLEYKKDEHGKYIRMK